ncbi:MAG: hypothetical protein LUF78_10400 [Clostridiales bacterium]|nr:hypothetical protein [Clostridiales bacterium]
MKENGRFLWFVVLGRIVKATAEADFIYGGVLTMETLKQSESLTLGEKIAQARKSAGLTQQQLAEKFWYPDRLLQNGNLTRVCRILKTCGNLLACWMSVLIISWMMERSRIFLL